MCGIDSCPNNEQIRAGTKVAAFIRCDVTKYNDNIALFKLAESEFGGVDVGLFK